MRNESFQSCLKNICINHLINFFQVCPPTIDPHKLVRELAKELRLAEKVTLNNSPAVKPARESNRKIKKKVLDEDFIDISRGNAFLFMGRVKTAKAKKPEKPSKPAKVPKEKPVKPVKEKPVKSPKKDPVKSPKKAGKPVSTAKEKTPVKTAKEKPVKAPKEKPVKTPKDKPQKPTKATKQAKVEKGSKPAKTEKNINNESSQPNAVVSLLLVFFFIYQVLSSKADFKSN